jgi:hypothetical protein
LRARPCCPGTTSEVGLPGAGDSALAVEYQPNLTP